MQELAASDVRGTPSMAARGPANSASTSPPPPPGAQCMCTRWYSVSQGAAGVDPFVGSAGSTPRNVQQPSAAINFVGAGIVLNRYWVGEEEEESLRRRGLHRRACTQARVFGRDSVGNPRRQGGQLQRSSPTISSLTNEAAPLAGGFAYPISSSAGKKFFSNRQTAQSCIPQGADRL